MGGNNTKLDVVSEWSKHHTSEQSSTIPYEAQIYNKYNNNNNNNIQELINNLHTEMSDYNFNNFTKLLNNTSSYNKKYENKLSAELDPSTVSVPTPAPPPNMRDSPFISPVKYANLLNSVTSENVQHGGARLPQTHKTREVAKRVKKPKKSKKTKTPEPESLTSSTDSAQNDSAQNDSNKTTDESDKKSDKDSDEESEEKSEEKSEEESEEESENNNKYQSHSSESESVHTSQINMLDSY